MERHAECEHGGGKIWLRWVACVALALGAMGCGDENGLVSAGGAPEEAERTARSAGLYTAPTSLRAALIHTMQRDANDSHAIRLAEGTLRAAAPGFEARFEPGGVALRRDGRGADDGTVSLARLGCPGALEPVEMTPPVVEANRVDYARLAGSVPVGEWYLAGPLGLEQGFTIAAAPRCLAASGELVLEMEAAGLAPELAEGGDAVALRDGSGEVAFRYGELFVEDAAGEVLPARLAVAGGRIELRIGAQGAALPIRVDPLFEQQKLTASDAAAEDSFGYSVAVSGDTALVGAAGDDHAGGTEAGSAYVFVRSGSVWSEQQKLTASDAAAYGAFGYSVALSGDTALVGAYPGGVYVFVRSNSVWSEQQKLTASDGASGDQFGSSVALSGDTALVGAYYDTGSATGTAYAFVRSGSVWSEQQKLTASDAAPGAYFGSSVALSGDTALVGAPRVYDGAGSAYVFVRSGSVWSEQQKLIPSDTTAYDTFGNSVALSSDTALVAARHAPGTDVGSAYVFVRSGSVWSEQQKLTGSDATGDDEFGWSVALFGDTALVSAPNDDHAGGTDAGTAYVFVRSGSVWSEHQKLTASDAAEYDLFSFSVALSGDTALVGAGFEDHAGGPDAGSAYVFVVQKTAGAPCASLVECLSGFCADGVCCDAACGGSAPDDCEACSVALGATGDGVCTFLTATSCDDADACTQTDSCQAGVCTGAMPVVCRGIDVCHDAGSCDPASGLCSNPTKPDGSPCSLGTCEGGVCTEGTGGGTGSGTGESTGAVGGGATAKVTPDDNGGCGCRVPSSGSGDREGALAALVLASVVLALRSRRRWLTATRKVLVDRRRAAPASPTPATGTHSCGRSGRRELQCLK